MLSGWGQHGKTTAIAAVVTLLAVLAPCAARGNEGNAPISFEGAGTAQLGTSPLRIWHRTRGYGEETSETALGTHWVLPAWGGQVFVDGQVRAGLSDHDLSTNAGIGYRWISEDFRGEQQIFGASLWYDGEDTLLDNWVNQIGVSFERLGDTFDLRLNANIPVEDTQIGSNTTLGTVFYLENFLAASATTGADVPLRVVDFEFAPRLLDMNVWVYGGGYQMDGDGVSDLGAKAGVRGYVVNDVVVDVSLTDDEVFGTTTAFQVIWTPGRTSAGCSDWSHRIADRLREQVYRNMYVATRQISVASSPALTAPGSFEPIRVVHVDSAAAAGGDGTFEAPLNRVDAIAANSQPGDIVLVHGGSSFTGQGTTLQEGQRLLGEGGNEEHVVVTAEFNEVALPETAPGAMAASVPLLQNAPGDAIDLVTGVGSPFSNSPMEVSNLRIDGASRGIATATGVSDISINRIEIQNTTGDGIDLTPEEVMVTATTSHARMNVLIAEATFSGVGGDDIHLDGSTALTNQIGTIAIADYTSTDGAGTGIALINANRAALIGNIDWDGGVTGVGGLLIQDATAAANVQMVGTNTITGGTTATPNSAGYAVRIANSAGSHTIGGLTVTDTGGDSVQVSGGTAGLAFTGRIDQANNASVVSVANHATGTISFSRLATGAGVIGATAGDGLQFSNADGTYRFNHNVNLNGGDAGVDIRGGSAGTFTFTDTDIANPTGTALFVDNSSAAVTYTGSIATDSSRPVVLTNNTGGSLTITAATTVESTGLGILIENNAGGAYLFAADVDLQTGANDAVQVVNNLSGSTRFNNLDITTTSGDGFTATNNQTHTVAVANAGNTIETQTGVGLHLDDVQVATVGVRFDSVSVDGATNGVIANDVRGGAVTIGSQGAALGDGGTIQNTSGAGVLIANAAQISLNNMTITGTGAEGVSYTVDAAATSRLTLNGNSITAATTETVALDVSGAATTVNISVTDNTLQNSNNQEALLLTTSGASAKTVNFLAQGNTVAGDSATAPAASLQIGDNSTVNATVGGANAGDGNTFNNPNAGPGRPFAAETTTATATLRLNLNGNTGAGVGNGFFLTETAGTFTVQDLANVNANNTGGVTVNGGVANDPGSIPTP